MTELMNNGIIYIIHMKVKIAHTQHYCGLCFDDPYARLHEHQATRWIPLETPICNAEGRVIKRGTKHGNGATLLAYANYIGVPYDIAKIWWWKPPIFERLLKDTHNVKVYCPKCMGRQVHEFNPDL